jgi:hypothetical protein
MFRPVILSARESSKNLLVDLEKVAKVRTDTTEHATKVDAAVAEFDARRWPKILAEILPAIC